MIRIIIIKALVACPHLLILIMEVVQVGHPYDEEALVFKNEKY